MLRLDAADSYHVHVADGFPDDGERVMPDFPIGDQVVGTDEVAGDLCRSSGRTRRCRLSG